jgi:hypothetical protein
VFSSLQFVDWLKCLSHSCFAPFYQMLTELGSVNDASAQMRGRASAAAHGASPPRTSLLYRATSLLSSLTGVGADASPPPPPLATEGSADSAASVNSERKAPRSGRSTGSASLSGGAAEGLVSIGEGDEGLIAQLAMHLSVGECQELLLFVMDLAQRIALEPRAQVRSTPSLLSLDNEMAPTNWTWLCCLSGALQAIDDARDRHLLELAGQCPGHHKL